MNYESIEAAEAASQAPSQPPAKRQKTSHEDQFGPSTEKLPPLFPSHHRATAPVAIEDWAQVEDLF
jgi:hypothetical protein